MEIDAITFDCHHPAPLARFWAAALDWEIAPYDEVELERLRAKGVDDPEDDPTVEVDPPDDALPSLFFVRVPEGKTVKNRVHLDLTPETTMVDEVDRLIGLGASILEPREDEDGGRWTVMLDPEGNEFCVIGEEG